MYLSQLLNGVSFKIYGEGNPDITSLSSDTSTVKQGCMFFCLKGSKHDGHDYFRKAIGDGAVAVVCQRKLETQALQIVVEDTRATMSAVAKNFYDSCADKLKIIGIVGTNGKTSTSYILDAILTKAGYNTAVIGTNGIFFNGQKHANLLTTPDPIELHYWFRQMYLNQVDVVVMEVSAHAIALRKMWGVRCDVALFTNFSQDHLDFFRTMENYRQVKKSFFSEKNVKNIVTNIDDELGRELIFENIPTLTYSVEGNADVVASEVTIDKNSSKYVLQANGQKAQLSTRLAGMFSVYNTLSAIATALTLGVDIDVAVTAVKDIEGIAGRNETIVRSDGARIVVDFAHTPDGIDNILSFLRKTSSGKLIVVFGCGGNRDKFKRPKIAEKVSRYADFAVLTNDNPRFEDPRLIARDIYECLTCKYRVILNRSQATEFALSIASANDTVAILGKGAEEYQDIKGRKYPYSDVEVVRNLLRLQ